MNTTDTNAMDASAPISEQAAYWWVVLQDAGTSADRRAFAEWVAKSPERVEAYLRVVTLMRALHSSDVRLPDVPAETLIREAREATGDVVPISSQLFPLSVGTAGARESFPLSLGERATVRKSFPLSLWERVRVRGMAAAALLLAITSTWFFLAGADRYQTRIGEQRSVLLDDGSLITLNTSSILEVDLTKDRRLIRLLDGEALFQVAHDPKRSFDVIAGKATIRAVGTQFNVDRRPTRTTVTVIEGKVAVLPQSLSTSPIVGEGGGKGKPQQPQGVRGVPVVLAAAERVVVTDSGLSAPERIANVAPVTAWTQRHLVFERRPLGEVAEEFNRYNRQRIHIKDAELRRQEVTGVFQANDPASFMTFLRDIPGVQIEQTDSGDNVITVHPTTVSTTGGPN